MCRPAQRGRVSLPRGPQLRAATLDVNSAYLESVILGRKRSTETPQRKRAELNINIDEKEDKYHGANLKCKSYFQRYLNERVTYSTQAEAFDAAMKFFQVIGCFLGFHPIANGGETKTSRCPLGAWRHLHCIIICVSQVVATVLCFYNILVSSVTIYKFANFSFYLITLISSVSFIRVSTKWAHLVQQLSCSRLDAYVDPLIGLKCRFTFIVTFVLALGEYALSMTAKATAAEECGAAGGGFQRLVRKQFFWLFDVGMPYSVAVGVLLLGLHFIVTMNWNYLHLFVICVSMYLSSILTLISKEILSREGQYLPPSQWRQLREEYNRASRLVRRFDACINGVTFVSLTSNMLFVCLQLYYVLAHGFRVPKCTDSLRNEVDSNHTRGAFAQYEYALFTVYSLALALGRALGAVLAAARVHSASAEAAPALLLAPAPTSCTEVQRLVDQMHSDTVALTGLDFFHVTKELLLTVMGTIVTYQLVLMQFDNSV